MQANITSREIRYPGCVQRYSQPLPNEGMHLFTEGCTKKTNFSFSFFILYYITACGHMRERLYILQGRKKVM